MGCRSWWLSIRVIFQLSLPPVHGRIIFSARMKSRLAMWLKLAIEKWAQVVSIPCWVEGSINASYHSFLSFCHMTLSGQHGSCFISLESWTTRSGDPASLQWTRVRNNLYILKFEYYLLLLQNVPILANLDGNPCGTWNDRRWSTEMAWNCVTSLSENTPPFLPLWIAPRNKSQSGNSVSNTCSIHPMLSF